MADVVVIGGGHAGCEAALAASRMGMDVLLLTLNMDGVALMACNPVIGGSAKGHLVRELDAMGGEMGLAIDDTFLQSRMLNVSKGPAVHALRAQADKQEYQNRMRDALFAQQRLTVREGECASIETENGCVTAVTTASGQRIPCRAAIVASGVYLRSRVIIGDWSQDAGPQGLNNAGKLSSSLTDMGFALRRFKTGTPARIDERTIDFDEMTIQPGDDPVVPFSFLTEKELTNTHACYLTWTNEDTHRVIRETCTGRPCIPGVSTASVRDIVPALRIKSSALPIRIAIRCFWSRKASAATSGMCRGCPPPCRRKCSGRCTAPCRAFAGAN